MLSQGYADRWWAEFRLICDGATARDRLRIARSLLDAHLHLGRGRWLGRWVPAGEDPPRELAFRSGVRLLARRRDAVPLFEQFGLDIYGVEIEARTIVDLGANAGFASVALAARHAGARFVCVEPDPESRRLLEGNLALNGLVAVVVGAAVVGVPGRYAIAAGLAPGANRVEPATGGAVEGVTMSEVLSRGGLDQVDLLKVDIEGSEADLFAGAAEWASRVRAVIAELHEPFGVAEADALLRPHGFSRVPLPAGVRFRDVTLWVRA